MCSNLMNYIANALVDIPRSMERLNNKLNRTDLTHQRGGSPVQERSGVDKLWVARWQQQQQQQQCPAASFFICWWSFDVMQHGGKLLLLKLDHHGEGWRMRIMGSMWRKRSDEGWPSTYNWQLVHWTSKIQLTLSRSKIPNERYANISPYICCHSRGLTVF